MIPAMIASLRHFLGWMVTAFRSREDLVLENLALRRQLLALRAQGPRPRLTACTSCSGLRYERSGLGGGSLSSWLLLEPW
jgi:hypothetical protein